MPKAEAPQLKTVQDIQQAASRRKSGQKFVDLGVWRKAVIAIAADEPQTVAEAESLDESREGLGLSWADFQTDVDVQRRLNENSEFLDADACTKKALAFNSKTVAAAEKMEAARVAHQEAVAAHRQAAFDESTFDLMWRDIAHLVKANPRMYAEASAAFDGLNCGFDLSKQAPAPLMGMGGHG